MHETGDQERDQADDPGREPRTTQQGDELTEEHALQLRDGGRVAPYRRPRQPAQDPPSE